jgi:broad specificity phosphatase PhoE
MTASLVGGAGDDSPVAGAAHRHRQPDERPVTKPLHLDEEGIHVDVQDRLGPHLGSKLPPAGDENVHNAPMAALVHLVRHGEADNPGHLVYADLPGFGLSPHGVEQARRVGRYLGPRPVVAIWSSPLERALRTAEEIASRTGIPVRVDPDLTEWGVAGRWRGHSWKEIPQLFPGELEAYLEHPEQLPFETETLEALADRMASTARKLDSEHPHGDIVIVSHQDPIQAGRLRLLGAPLGDLHQDKPGHGAVITLRPGPAWRVETVWEPGESPRFGERSGLRVVGQSQGPEDPASA